MGERGTLSHDNWQTTAAAIVASLQRLFGRFGIKRDLLFFGYINRNHVEVNTCYVIRKFRCHPLPPSSP